MLDTESGQWSHSAADIGEEWLRRFAVRKQYIGQLETLAAAAAYFTLGHILVDRHVIHFIDNVGALSALGKGYTTDIDSARLSHAFHLLNARLRVSVWFNYVASGANISDLPSRDDIPGMQAIISGLCLRWSEWVEMKWPPFGSWADIAAGVAEGCSALPPPAVVPAAQRTRGRNASGSKRGWDWP